MPMKMRATATPRPWAYCQLAEVDRGLMGEPTMIAGFVEPGCMPVGFDESVVRAARGTCMLGPGGSGFD